LRDYQPQDDLRYVDWKATARVRRIIVREFASEEERRVSVIFDTTFPQTDEEKTKTLQARINKEQRGERISPASERFEKGISLTASLLAHFAEEQAKIRLLIGDEISKFGFGKNHLADCLKRLALVEPNFDAKAEFSVETLNKISAERKNGYTFFVTAQAEEKLPGEIIRIAKIIGF